MNIEAYKKAMQIKAEIESLGILRAIENDNNNVVTLDTHLDYNVNMYDFFSDPDTDCAVAQSELRFGSMDEMIGTANGIHIGLKMALNYLRECDMIKQGDVD
jgi:hypothetical protein